jgi:hypothetical protein
MREVITRSQYSMIGNTSERSGGGECGRDVASGTRSRFTREARVIVIEGWCRRGIRWGGERPERGEEEA